ASPGARTAKEPAEALVLNLIGGHCAGQWTKNLLVFAGLLFGRRLCDAQAVAEALLAFAIFCALSGAVYLVNDVADRESDRKHPVKALRPIAAGAVPVSMALFTAVVLVVGALAASMLLGSTFTLVAAAYVVLQ